MKNLLRRRWFAALLLFLIVLPLALGIGAGKAVRSARQEMENAYRNAGVRDDVESCVSLASDLCAIAERYPSVSADAVSRCRDAVSDTRSALRSVSRARAALTDMNTAVGMLYLAVKNDGSVDDRDLRLAAETYTDYQSRLSSASLCEAYNSACDAFEKVRASSPVTSFIAGLTGGGAVRF